MTMRLKASRFNIRRPDPSAQAAPAPRPSCRRGGGMSYLSGAFVILGILVVLYVASVIEAIGFVHGLRILALLSRAPRKEPGVIDTHDGGAA